MPLFDGKPDISLELIKAYLKKHYPNLEEINDESTDNGILSFCIKNATIMFAPMQAPLPWSDLEGPCATSILWKNAEEEVKRHSDHMILTVMDEELSPVEISTLLTQATAAVLSTCSNALGVYWGNATLLVPKDLFCDFATKILPEGPPLHIWIDFRIGPDDNETSTGFTTGLAALDLMEIEAIKAPEACSSLRDRLSALADYLLSNGLVIKDGDTVGGDEEERIKVAYKKSMFGHKEKVIRLMYENTIVKQPWYKFW